MNKMIFILLFLGLSSRGICQEATGEKISAGIAKRLQDSLSLTNAEKVGVEEVNRLLAARKQVVFNEFTNPDSLRVNLQRVENMRDSLYKGVLPIEKYQMYKEKKRNLINNR